MKKRMILLMLLGLVSVSQAVTVHNTGIHSPYQGKSTHNYEDYYTYYAQSFRAPEQWMWALTMPLFENQYNSSKNNPDFTIELWDDMDNVIATSPIYDAPKNDVSNPVFYSIGSTSIELVVGDVYWVVYNPLPDNKAEAWCGFYRGNFHPSTGCYNKQYFAPADIMVTGIVPYSYRALFGSQHTPEPATISILGIGVLFLRRNKSKRKEKENEIKTVC